MLLEPLHCGPSCISDDDLKITILEGVNKLAGGVRVIYCKTCNSKRYDVKINLNEFQTVVCENIAYTSLSIESYSTGNIQGQGSQE